MKNQKVKDCLVKHEMIKIKGGEITNIMKVKHDTAKSAINNIR